MINTLSKKSLVTGLSALALSISLAGCSSSDPKTLDLSSVNKPTFDNLSATVRYTTGGVPHITADTLKDAGFASGYVQAEANACIIADQIIRAKGERAKHYGPGESINPPLSASLAGANIVSDFSVKAIGLYDYAKEHYDELSDNSKDLLDGFAQGYNTYLVQTNNLTSADKGRFGKCAGESWVKPITPQELFAYYSLVSQYASGMQFATGATFFATPYTLVEALPHAPSIAKAETPTALKNAVASVELPAVNFGKLGMGSNGWGIGKDLTENGKGALLANPHFPYTGGRRLFQMHINVPSVGYNVNGAALLGVVIPLIGFNDSVAWTHTVSTGRHFTVYQHKLAPNNKMQYVQTVKDGDKTVEKTKDIVTKSITIEVNTGAPKPTTLQKEFYYTAEGDLMLNMNLATKGLFPNWGENYNTDVTKLPPQLQAAINGYSMTPVIDQNNGGFAFSYRDANKHTVMQIMDQWLEMGQAKNLKQFKATFEDKCSSVLWVNTMYADKEGNAFYIDGTGVPKLSADTINSFNAARIPSPDSSTFNPYVTAVDSSSITLLDGSTDANNWVEDECKDGIVGYKGMPKLDSTQYVQNSNDSYWATNLGEIGTMSAANYSPLYGDNGMNPVTPRTRLGIKMLEEPTNAGKSKVKPAGDDGKFTAKEIMDNLYSNRAFYAETLLDELLSRCDDIGTTKVNDRSVKDGCDVLAEWDGLYNVDSVGAHVFRVFAASYDAGNANSDVPYNPLSPSPADTPSGFKATDPNKGTANDPMLIALAKGLNLLDDAKIAYDAKLGDVQYVQMSKSVKPDAVAEVAGNRIPWGGNQNLEGGFNIVAPELGAFDEGTRYPRVAPEKDNILANSGNLSKQKDLEGWQILYGTSWHFGLQFNEDGPEAYGLVSYSQSTDSASENFHDQSDLYSKKEYRKLLFSNADINKDPNLKEVKISTQQ